MRFAALVFGILAGCDSCAHSNANWPLTIHLESNVSVSDVVRRPLVDDGRSAENRHAMSITSRTYRASELRLSSDADYVLVDLEDGARWVLAAPPLSAAQDEFLRGLGQDVYVRFFSDGDRAIVVTEEGTMAVQVSSGRVRLLDSRTATLENCEMSAGRREYECVLDMMWESTRFDADGNSLDGNFTPHWKLGAP